MVRGFDSERGGAAIRKRWSKDGRPHGKVLLRDLPIPVANAIRLLLTAESEQQAHEAAALEAIALARAGSGQE